MNLNETQKQQVAQWITDGLKLAEIQNRINAELGLTLTYMDVRLLVDDLKLTPKDATPPAAPEKSVLSSGVPPPPTPLEKSAQALAGESIASPGGKAVTPGGNVNVTVDSLARPGALVSGSVKFSDGQTAGWYLDQMGRLGLAPQQQGYRPSAADLQSFQQALETELSKLGL